MLVIIFYIFFTIFFSIIAGFYYIRIIRFILFFQSEIYYIFSYDVSYSYINYIYIFFFYINIFFLFYFDFFFECLFNFVLL